MGSNAKLKEENKVTKRTRGAKLMMKRATDESARLKIHQAGKPLKRKNLRERILSRPLTSPPPRLRRLGVRQIDDAKSGSPTTTECSSEVIEEGYRKKRTAKSEAMDLLRKLALDGDCGMVSPSSRQLEKFLESQSAQKSVKPENGEGEGSEMSSLNPLGRTTVLKCPVCDKVFLSFHGHDLHLDTHDSASIKCWPCNLRFNSNKSLQQHQRLRHKKKDDELHAGLGFHNIIYADFSSDKYPAISQTYCENNSTQAASHFHEYNCTECQKSFPISSALDLHINQHHYTPSKFICTLCNHDYSTKSQLDLHKQTFAMRKHLTDPKRKFIRALSLTPKCAEQSLIGKRKDEIHVPIDYGYYEKLKQVDQANQLFYKSEPIADHEDSESSQSS